jgi:hypothetical protein
VFNAEVPSDTASDYRVAPSLAGRLLGVALVLVGVLVFAVTLVVAVLRLSIWTVLVVAVVGVLGTAVAAWATRRAIVVRLDDLGYRVRFVRGVGASAARWPDVRDGRTTTIPVEALDVDPEAFARDVHDHLARGG